MLPFPEPKGEPLQPNTALQESLNEALASSPQPLPAMPIALVAIKPGAQTHPFAEVRGLEMHYSASLLKVAAMYTAFELRTAAIQLIANLGLGPDEVFPKLHSVFDAAIKANRVPQLAALKDEQLLPRYEQMFSVDPTTGGLNFSNDYFAKLDGAIADGSNPMAGASVHGVGFGYLTKAMETAGFLRPTLTAQPKTADGIWLAGDFKSGYEAQRIPCVNDTPVAQATSVRQMARLFTLLTTRKLMNDGVSDDSMMEMLARAVANGHKWLSLDPTIHFTTAASKIGLGPVNGGGPEVASEALVIEETSRQRFFVVVFQNLRLAQNPASAFAVARIVDQAIASFPAI